MPNRKTFDERERYDHSGRPLSRRQKNDLGPGLSEQANSADDASATAAEEKSPASAQARSERRLGGRETGG
jgi:hypothetical protein